MLLTITILFSIAQLSYTIFKGEKSRRKNSSLNSDLSE